MPHHTHFTYHVDCILTGYTFLGRVCATQNTVKHPTGYYTQNVKKKMEKRESLLKDTSKHF